jgi:1,4-alpha-glucan branching enzyme
VGRSIVRRESDVDAAPTRHEILEATPRGTRVRLRVEAPRSAARVEVLGDFTLWEPVAMTRTGDHWEVELHVGPGAHHYGYLADGEWYVPEDEPTRVPDEWGRMSAILVVEEES